MEIETQNGIRRQEIPINHGRAPLVKDHKVPEVASLTYLGREKRG